MTMAVPISAHFSARVGSFSSLVKDGRPFHTTSGNIAGGFCADIHHTAGIVPSDSFALVICTFVFEHLSNPLVAAKNIFDMLAPGGYLVWAAPSIEVGFTQLCAQHPIICCSV